MWHPPSHIWQDACHKEAAPGVTCPGALRLPDIRVGDEVRVPRIEANGERHYTWRAISRSLIQGLRTKHENLAPIKIMTS